ncbi:hypothetical protein AOLI_G00135100 [Acnodon oligacanthus]
MATPWCGVAVEPLGWSWRSSWVAWGGEQGCHQGCEEFCGLVVQGLSRTWLPWIPALKHFHMSWSRETLLKALCQPQDRPESGQELILAQQLKISATLYF